MRSRTRNHGTVLRNALSSGLLLSCVLAVASVATVVGATVAAASDERSAGIMQVATGPNHTLALTLDGTVWAWGSNEYGQLGDGTTTDRPTPVRVPSLGRVIAVAAGKHHSIAIQDDGSVWAWGNNARGQLGDSTRINRASPVRVGLPMPAPPTISRLPAPEPRTWTSPTSTQVTEVASIDKPGYHQVAISPDGKFVLAGSEHRNEVAFLGSDGTVLWTYALPETIEMENGAVADKGNLVVVGGQGDGVYALTRSGRLKWSDRSIKGECQVAVTRTGDRVFVAARRNLYCYDGDGQRLWARSMDTKQWSIWGLKTTPRGDKLLVRTNSDIIICDGDGNPIAVHDIVEGNHLASADLSPDGRQFAASYSLPSEGEAAADPKRRTQYVALFSIDGKERWRHPVASFARVAIDTRGRVFAAVRSGEAWVWANDGQPLISWPAAGLNIAVSRNGTHCAIGRAQPQQPSLYTLTFPESPAAPVREKPRSAAPTPSQAKRAPLVDNEQYALYAPATHAADWQAAREWADRVAAKHPERESSKPASLLLVRLELADAPAEQSFDIRLENAALHRPGSDGYFPSGSTVRSGDVIILRHASPSKAASLQVGTLRHHSPTIPLEFEANRIVEMGTLRVKSFPKDQTGQVTVTLRPEPGLDIQPGEAVVIGRHFAGTLSARHPVDAGGVCRLEDVAPGRYLVKATSPGQFSSPLKPLEVLVGQTAEVQIDVTRVRTIQFEWAFQPTPTDGWKRGERLLKSGDLWHLSNDLKGLSGYPFARLSEWTGTGSEISFSQCRWELLGTGALADFMDEPEDGTPQKAAIRLAQGSVFRLSPSSTATSGANWTVLVRVGRIEHGARSEAELSDSTAGKQDAAEDGHRDKDRGRRGDQPDQAKKTGGRTTLAEQPDAQPGVESGTRPQSATTRPEQEDTDAPPTGRFSPWFRRVPTYWY